MSIKRVKGGLKQAGSSIVLKDGAADATTLEKGANASTVTFTLPNQTGSKTLVSTDSTATLSNKTLDNTSTITVKDANLTIQDDADTTKQVKFEASGVTAGQTRTLTVPDASTTLVGTDTTQTLTNKTMTSATIVVASNTITTAASGNLAATELNTALAELQTDIDTRATSAALTSHTGADSGVHGLTGTVVGTSDSQTLTNKTLGSTNNITDATASSFTNVGTVSLPTATTTLVGRNTTDTLTNKTINGANNTITNVSLATGVTGTLPVANGGTGQTTQTAAFDALAPTTTKGDLIIHNGTDNIRVAVGTDGQVLTADSAEPSGLKYTSPLTNPMSAVGDIIIGGASGAATRLAGNTTTTRKFLRQTGDGAASAAPTWDTLVVGDLPSEVTSGRWTPTITNIAGIGSTTANSSHYSRTRNQVTVHGSFVYQADSAGASMQVGISLPISSNFTASSDATGVATTGNSSPATSGYVTGDSSNDRLQIDIIASSESPTLRTMWFTAQYEIK